MLDQLLQWDKDLFLFFNGMGSEKWDGLWLFITHKFSSIPLYATLLYLIYREFGWKETLVIVICVALMITATDQFANLFKHGFKRPRPCQFSAGMTDQMRFIAQNCGRYGYFSAHAASAMAAAIYVSCILKHRYKLLPVILLIWALLTGYSRIYLGVHYPFDVLTGMIIGLLFGYLFYILQKWARRKFVKQENRSRS